MAMGQQGPTVPGSGGATTRDLVTIMVTINLIVVMMVTMSSGQLAFPPPNQDEGGQEQAGTACNTLA